MRKFWPDPGEGLKICRKCESVFPLDQFTQNKRGIKGVAAYCKPCFAKHYAVGRAAARDATKRYRERHRIRWLLLHRSHQVERRRRNPVSISTEDEALIKSQVECRYCGKPVPEAERTIDHIVPLAKGGSNDISNLTMACRSCNSSKKDKSLLEWAWQRLVQK